MEQYTPTVESREEVGLLLDTQDARLSVRFTNRKSRPGGADRGEIREFSPASRRRLIWEARNIPSLHSILTFTYPHGDYSRDATGGDYMLDGRVVKNHLRKLRQILTYRGLSGFWFLEFQERGAPHFHFFLVGTLSPDQIAKLRRSWSRMVGTMCPHHPVRGIDYQPLKKQSAAASYAAKYSSKSEQKTVPEQYRGVGRFWGVFGDTKRPVLQVQTSIKEIYKLARVAKNYAKAKARADGYRIRNRYGSGIQGYAVYCAAPILKVYLARRYIVPDIPPGTSLELHSWQRPASDNPG